MIRAKTTLADALREGAERLARSGSDAPRQEAERLAAHALGMRWGDLFTRLREHFDMHAFDALVDRRVAHEPLAYILGTAEFYGIVLQCGPGVLVPRPETERLVETALDAIADRERPVVVDLGTGTGAIAVAIKTKRPDADVWATEVAPGALVWAKRNAGSVHLVEGDLFSPLPQELRGSVDLVVSNPPYIPDGTALPPDVEAEPPEALFAGPDGLRVIRRIVDEASDWLRPGGTIALEVGTPEQAASVASMLPEGKVFEDLTGRPRVVSSRC